MRETNPNKNKNGSVRDVQFYRSACLLSVCLPVCMFFLHVYICPSVLLIIPYFRENFMKVHIYFEILSIKEVEKVGAYKWSNLLGKTEG